MKKSYYGKEARELLKKGAHEVYKAVGVTLGPRGRTVVIERPNNLPHATKDGVSVAREVYFPGDTKNIGSQIIRQASQETMDAAGDGTTTATVLTYKMIQEALDHINNGINHVQMKKGMEAEVERVVRFIKDNAIEVDDDSIKNIIRVSTNNDEALTEIVYEALNAVNKTGKIIIDDSFNAKTSVEKQEGIDVGTGWADQGFINNWRTNTCELSKVRVLVTDREISDHKDIQPALQICAKTGASLLIISPDVYGQALDTVIHNHRLGAIPACIVQTPGYGEDEKNRLSDIAAACGAKVIWTHDGTVMSTKFEPSALGYADKIVSSMNNTFIVNGNRNEEAFANQLASAKHLMDEGNEQAKDRYEKLTGGMAVIRVGGNTKTEVQEKKDRVDDAVRAAKAAVEEGILPGGGAAFVHYLSNTGDDVHSEDPTDSVTGRNVVRSAIASPIREILSNGGYNEDQINNKEQEVAQAPFQHGFNLNTEQIENMIESGIVDPAKVTRCAIENALSAALTIVLSEAVVAIDYSKAE